MRACDAAHHVSVWLALELPCTDFVVPQEVMPQAFSILLLRLVFASHYSSSGEQHAENEGSPHLATVVQHTKV